MLNIYVYITLENDFKRAINVEIKHVDALSTSPYTINYVNYKCDL